MQHRTTKFAQAVVGGCIYLGKMIFYRQSYYDLDLDDNMITFGSLDNCKRIPHNPGKFP